MFNSEQVLGTAIASNQLMTGNHYPIPTTLNVEIQQTFVELSNILGEQIVVPYPMTLIHRAKFDINGKHACTHQCCNFPVQNCSSSCGIIAIICSLLSWHSVQKKFGTMHVHHRTSCIVCGQCSQCIIIQVHTHNTSEMY